MPWATRASSSVSCSIDSGTAGTICVHLSHKIAKSHTLGAPQITCNRACLPPSPPPWRLRSGCEGASLAIEPACLLLPLRGGCHPYARVPGSCLTGPVGCREELRMPHHGRDAREMLWGAGWPWSAWHHSPLASLIPAGSQAGLDRAGRCSSTCAPAATILKIS